MQTKLNLSKNKPNICHTAKEDLQVLGSILYTYASCIRHMTFQQYSEEGRESFELHRTEGVKSQKQEFSPKPARNSKNPLYDAERRNPITFVSNFRDNRAKTLGRVVYPNFPDFSIVLGKNSGGILVIRD